MYYFFVLVADLCRGRLAPGHDALSVVRINGIVVEYIVAIDVTRVRFQALF